MSLNLPITLDTFDKLTFGLVCFAFVIYFSVLYMDYVNPKIDPVPKCYIKSKVLIGITILIYTLNVGLLMQVRAHGYYDKDIRVTSIPLMLERSPVESKLPDDLSGSILIFYRMTCPDCQDIHDELMIEIQNIEKHYFISTRSPNGKKLAEKYQLTSIPCAVYVHVNGTDFTRYDIYYENKDTGDAEFDYEYFDRIKQLYHEQR